MCIKVPSWEEKMPPKEELLFNMEKVLSFSEKYRWQWKNAEKFKKVPSKAEKNAIQGRVAVQYGKGTTCLRIAEKMPSKEDLLFNMEKVASV